MKSILHDRSASHYRGIQYSPKKNQYIETRAAGGPGSRRHKRELEEGQVAHALVKGPELKWQKREVPEESLRGHRYTADAMRALESVRQGYSNLHDKASRKDK